MTSPPRKAEVVRNTTETQIRVAVNLDGTGSSTTCSTRSRATA